MAWTKLYAYVVLSLCYVCVSLYYIYVTLHVCDCVLRCILLWCPGPFSCPLLLRGTPDTARSVEMQYLKLSTLAVLILGHNFIIMWPREWAKRNYI